MWAFLTKGVKSASEAIPNMEKNGEKCAHTQVRHVVRTKTKFPCFFQSILCKVSSGNVKIV